MPILFVKRTREVYKRLKGCPAQRDVYDALDFHRNPVPEPEIRISDAMTYTKLAQLSGTARQRIPYVLNQLIQKGLIQKVVAKKKYVFQYILVDVKEEAEVIPFQRGEPKPDAEYESSKAEFLTGSGD